MNPMGGGAMEDAGRSCTLDEPLTDKNYEALSKGPEK
jgi:hypothetical protein